MTTTAVTGRPPWSVVCWTDNTHLFIEIPGANGSPPYIEKYALTEGAFSKALAFMKSLHTKAEPSGGTYVLPSWPGMKKVPSGQGITANSRERAHAILKARGLI
jgi:hypothetical protein